MEQNFKHREEEERRKVDIHLVTIGEYDRGVGMYNKHYKDISKVFNQQFLC